MCYIKCLIVVLILLSSSPHNGLEIEKTSVLRDLIALFDELITILKELIIIVNNEAGMEQVDQELLDPEIDRMSDINSTAPSTSESTYHANEEVTTTIDLELLTMATTVPLSPRKYNVPLWSRKFNDSIAETTYENPTNIRSLEVDTLKSTHEIPNTSETIQENKLNETTITSKEENRTVQETDSINSTSGHVFDKAKDVHSNGVENEENRNKSNVTVILKRKKRKQPTTLEQSLSDLEYLFNRKLISEETVQLLKNCVQYLGELLARYNYEQNSTVLENLNQTDLKQILKNATIMQKKLQQIQSLVEDANSLTVSNQRYIILCSLFLALGILILLLMICLLVMNKKIQRLANRVGGRDRHSDDYWTMGTATTDSVNDALASRNNNNNNNHSNNNNNNNNRQSVWEEPPFLSHYIGNNYRSTQEESSAVNDRWIDPLSDNANFWKRSRDWSGRDFNRIPKIPPQDYYLPTVSGCLTRYDPVTLRPLRSN